MSLIEIVEERGPLTVAAFLDLALYDPTAGYYSRAAQRSGRAGDFFTSVDVGPVFGAMIAQQVSEMADHLPCEGGPPDVPFDLVEAGAGNGRLSRDILSALRDVNPALYARTRLSLVEASPAARAAQAQTLGDMSSHLVWSDTEIPRSFSGVLIANELLDAFPVHQVVMRPEGLRETYVIASRHASGQRRLATIEGTPSTPALAAYLSEAGVELEPGQTAEINLRAVEWITRATRSLERGFILLFDYGHEASELYSARHGSGTLTTFARHQAAGTESASPATPAWLDRPGEQDITAHVDFTSVRRAAERAGAVALGFLDQTYFLLLLLQPSPGGTPIGAPAAPPTARQGLLSAMMESAPSSLGAVKARLALKTLLQPGGLGSTLKVLIMGKGMGCPALSGCSYRMRIT